MTDQSPKFVDYLSTPPAEMTPEQREAARAWLLADIRRRRERARVLTAERDALIATMERKVRRP